MSNFFAFRCNCRQNGGREPRGLKDIPDGISRGPTEDEAYANKRTKERRRERIRQQQRKEQERNERRVWVLQVS